MTILITADLHLSANPRDEYRFLFLEKTLPKLIEEEGVGLLLVLGDLTEDKHGHEAELVNRIVNGFHKLAQLCPIVILQGNHDWQSSPDNPYFGFLGRLRDVVWVRDPTPLARLKTVPETVARACKGLLLPHSANPDRDWAEIDFGRYEYVFAHQCFAGALSESGHQLGGVSMSWFPRRVKVIAGDIHRPQEHGQLIYVGSPYCVDFGDGIEPRVLILSEGALESVPVPGPQKRLIEIDDLRSLRKVKLNPGDILKVRASVGSYEAWPEFQKGIAEWAEDAGVILHQSQPIIQNPLSGKVSLSKNAAKSDEELLKEYAQKRQLGEGHLKTGLKLL